MTKFQNTMSQNIYYHSKWVEFEHSERIQICKANKEPYYSMKDTTAGLNGLHLPSFHASSLSLRLITLFIYSYLQWVPHRFDVASILGSSVQLGLYFHSFTQWLHAVTTCYTPGLGRISETMEEYSRTCLLSYAWWFYR